MLGFFIIGIAVLAALIIGGNAIANANPKSLIRSLRISAAIILGGLAAFFAYTGRFQFAPPLALAALFFIRKNPIFGSSRPTAGQQSDVKTDWLHATLDHDSGHMDAEIIQGGFQGKKLSDLSFENLSILNKELQDDEQSIAILAAYIDRNFGSDAEGGKAHRHRNEYQSNSEQQNGMSNAEACEILDLKPGSNDTEIKAAHKRLMKKFHPDHDGSAYMAAKINQAKDTLLKS